MPDDNLTPAPTVSLIPPVPPVTPVPSPWQDLLLDALHNVQHTLLIVSPYIKANVVDLMKQALLARPHAQNTGMAIRVITRVEPADLLDGSSDIAALQHLLSWPAELSGSTVEMRAIPNVHAKVWVCDRHLAIVGSGNATLSGLTGNLEYGLAVSDPKVVARILDDWQPWWDQAERVEANALEKLEHELQTFQMSDARRQAEAQNEIVRQALRAIPRIGTRVVLSRKERSSPVLPGTSSPVPPSLSGSQAHRQQTPQLSNQISERVSSFDEDKHSPSVPNPPDTETETKQARITIPAPEGLDASYLAPEAINIPVTALWQALCWVLPIDEAANNLISAHTEQDAHLKFAWRSISPEHQVLQLIWADGKRYSEASLPTPNEALHYPWVATLNLQQIRMLGEMLRSLMEEKFFEIKAQQHFRLLLKTSPYTLFVAYLRTPTDRWSSAAMAIPCAPGSLPAHFPTLSPPISRLTVPHEQLQTALASLTHKSQPTPDGTSQRPLVELAFDASAQLTLSTGQIESPHLSTISGTDCICTGPEVRLRLDAASLQQVSASPRWNVSAWHLSVGRQADAIQFMPEPGIGLSAQPWRHELRYV